MRELKVQTRKKQELVDITQQVAEVAEDGDSAALLVSVPHTTAGIVINENADPDVGEDILSSLERMAPTTAGYQHREGNADAHVKASIVGTSKVLPVESRRLALGTWQGIFLAEFDGPRSRTVHVVPIATAQH